MFTAGNIAAGYYAISQAIQGTASDPWHFDHAAKAIGFAIVFDFFDGGIARLTNTTSAFGRELDSMADVIAFGVAPAVLAWMWGFRMLPLAGDPDLRNRVIQLGAIATFVFLLAGASRLARFNIQVNPSLRIPVVQDASISLACPFRRAQERLRLSSTWCKEIRCSTGGFPSDGVSSSSPSLS